MNRETPTNEAIARRTGATSTHRLAIRHHELIADEPEDLGGEDQGPTPQELLAASVAACTAITVEMYARRKGWDIDPVEVRCGYTTAERGEPTAFDIVLRLPSTCSDEQVVRLGEIAARCPVHRTLEGEIAFRERVERRSPDERPPDEPPPDEPPQPHQP